MNKKDEKDIQEHMPCRIVTNRQALLKAFYN